jgi:hypothetical protein
MTPKTPDAWTALWPYAVEAVPEQRAPTEPRTRRPDAEARAQEAADRNNAASELFETGQYAEAVPVFEEALEASLVGLGSTHPGTLRVAGNLGVAQVAAGQRRSGIDLIAMNLAARVRVLGDEHPETLVARDALAAAHRSAGDADTAVALAEEVVVQRTRTLGVAHPDTLRSRAGLALAVAAVGDEATAHRLLVSAVSDARAALGADDVHVRTLVDCGEAHGLLDPERR